MSSAAVVIAALKFSDVNDYLLVSVACFNFVLIFSFVFASFVLQAKAISCGSGSKTIVFSFFFSSMSGPTIVRQNLLISLSTSLKLFCHAVISCTFLLEKKE